MIFAILFAANLVIGITSTWLGVVLLLDPTDPHASESRPAIGAFATIVGTVTSTASLYALARMLGAAIADWQEHRRKCTTKRTSGIPLRSAPPRNA